MKGNEFIRKVRKLGRRRGVTVAFVPERGKGSHGTLYYGDKLTIVRNPKDKLKTGTLHAMLAQLGLTLTDLTDL
jgi:mRNA interferase HicA